MNHLEELLAEYYEWQGHVVKCNAVVGRLPGGGWEMELDVVTYDPKAGTILHLEPSLDGNSWKTRGTRFDKKFKAGRKYIPTDLFPWVPAGTPIVQCAILITTPKDHSLLAGVAVRSVDEMVGEIKAAVSKRGVMAHGAISEHYPLLRTIQLATCGYFRLANAATPPGVTG